MKLVSPNGPELAHRTLVGLFKSASEVYTTDDFKVFVLTGTVPDVLVDALAAGVVRHWSVLQGVENPQVIEAVREARPEVAEIITSPQGREWVNRLAGRLTILVPLRMMSHLFA